MSLMQLLKTKTMLFMKTSILTKELNAEELIEINGGSIGVKLLNTILAFIKGEFSPQL